AVCLELAFLAGLHVADEDTRHAPVLGAENLLDDGVEDEVDALVRTGAVDHDRRCAKRLAAMDDRDLGCELGEEGGLLHGGVAAADDHDLAILEERGIAHGAVRDTAAL